MIILFHFTASARLRINSIGSIVVDGVSVDSPDLVKKEVAKHFEHHFNGGIGVQLADLNCLFRKLSVESMKFPERPFTKKKV